MSLPEIQPVKKPVERNIFTILDRMIQVIPNEGEEHFKCDLEHQMEKAAYTPPENIYAIWRNVQYIITERFKTHYDKSTLPQWSVSFIAIWTDTKND
jgi:hypothetical protein